MKKLIFLLIPLLLLSLVSSCAPVTNDSETVKQKTLRQIEQAKERAEQKLTPQRRMEIAKSRQAELSEYAKARQAERLKQIIANRERIFAEANARQKQTEQKLTVQELYVKKQKEQKAKYKRFKEECVEFIKNEDGSLKNKTTPEVKKLVDQWNYYWSDHLIERMGQEWVIQNAEEVFNLEIFYKIFGKPWKTQFMEDSYVLWYICKDGNVLITVGDVFDDGLVLIRNLNIL